MTTTTTDIATTRTPSSTALHTEIGLEKERHLHYLFTLLESQNSVGYIGEPVSQLAHSLQAAHLAALSESSEDTCIAALFHDVGQIVPVDTKLKLSRAKMRLNNKENDDRGENAMEEEMKDGSGQSVGRKRHDWIGEEYLRQHGWGKGVYELVGAHVIAKRYLACSATYLDSLSPASQASLKQQGGPFTPSQVLQFQSSDPLWQRKVLVRKCDDGAKIPDKRTRTLREWWDVAQRVYNGQGKEKVVLFDWEKTELESLTGKK